MLFALTVNLTSQTFDLNKEFGFNFGDDVNIVKTVIEKANGKIKVIDTGDKLDTGSTGYLLIDFKAKNIFKSLIYDYSYLLFKNNQLNALLIKDVKYKRKSDIQKLIKKLNTSCKKILVDGFEFENCLIKIDVDNSDIKILLNKTSFE